MHDAALLDEITQIIRAVAKVPPNAPISPESRLIDDLGIDSLDLVGVFLKIQDDYDVVIDDDDVPSLRNIRDLAAYVSRRRPSAAA